MLTDKVPEPALQVLTTNSEATPVEKRTMQKYIEMMKGYFLDSSLKTEIKNTNNNVQWGDIYLWFLPAVQGHVQ